MSRRRALAILTGASLLGAIAPALRALSPGAAPARRYSILPVGQIRPRGWILQQMQDDLATGIPGHIQTYAREITKQCYVKQDTGYEPAGWWSAEQEGYWLDGVTRLAILAGDTARLAEMRAAYDAILARQALDPDGYIGCYNAATRYTDAKPDGELWSKSRLFQGMLAFYEFSGEPKYLGAVEKAVALDRRVYAQKNYFARPAAENGGVAHAIGYFDTLDYLWRITGKREYLDFAMKFYGDFNQVYGTTGKFIADLATDHLSDPARKLADHTPHICEGWYVPALAFTATGDDTYRHACTVADAKLKYHCTPGGAMVGDELVRARPGTGYMEHEYCAMAELVSSLTRRLQYLGEPADADAAEKLALNDGQGARFHQPARAVQYLSCDNRKEIPATAPQNRQYRPLHDAACCALNVGRMMPYYVEGLWLRTEDEPGLAAMRYGPSVVETTIGGARVRIEQETAYPFEDRVVLRVTTDRPAPFLIQLHVPAVAAKASVQCPAGMAQKTVPGGIQLRGTWETGHAIELAFDFPVTRQSSPDGEQYLQRGPLVFAAKFAHREVKTQQRRMKDGPLADFWDYTIERIDDAAAWDGRLDAGATFEKIAPADGDPLRPFASPPVALRGALRDAAGKPMEVTLVPMGATVLRRVTFPV